MRGELLAVITTDALELGIDIGALDAAVVVTFPGTVASLRQMWGRAGRRGRGLAVYVAGEDALDQFFCRHPDEFLDRAVEAAILEYENEQIHLAHLLCAAHEGPLSAGDAQTLGPRWEGHAQALVAAGELVERRGEYLLRQPEDYPAARVSLRSASPDSFAIVDVSSGELLGTVESARAHTTVHDGAIYLHQGRSYIVRELELDTRRALVEPVHGRLVHAAQEGDDDGDRGAARPARDARRDALLRSRRRDRAGARLPAQEALRPRGRRPPGARPARDDVPDAGAVVRARRRPARVRLPARDPARRRCTPPSTRRSPCCRCWRCATAGTSAACRRTPTRRPARPTIFIYDGHPGGVGITRQGFARFETLVGDAHRLIAECPCEQGCPSCVQSPKCGNLNEPLAKAGALELMARMLER